LETTEVFAFIATKGIRRYRKPRPGLSGHVEPSLKVVPMKFLPLSPILLGLALSAMPALAKTKAAPVQPAPVLSAGGWRFG
jgi:hypothetical protein